jgi:hypothetical protein|tara:strand:- start:744 stop:1253 length:510 start_codon:yes stop_codon:yes gene_type:complete
MNDQTPEEAFFEAMDKIKVLSLTRWEALYLSDSMTLLLELEAEKGKVSLPARNLQASAVVSVPIEMIERIGFAVLLATDPKNETGMTEMPVKISELYMLRECCHSTVRMGNELVGYNLLRKIYKLLLEEDLKQKDLIDSLTADIELDLEKNGSERSDADTRTDNPRRRS